MPRKLFSQVMRRRRLRAAGLLAVAVVGSLVWESRRDLFSRFFAEPQDRQSCVRSDDTPSAIERWFENRWLTKTDREHRTDQGQILLVLIGTDVRSDAHTSVCANRSIVADLLETLFARGAKEVIVDKHYAKGSCRELLPNRHLVEVMSRFHDRIVVGQQTEIDEETRCPVIKDNFDFGASPPRFGLLELNQEHLKIPLSWTISDGRTDRTRGVHPLSTRDDLGTKLPEAPALALVAAETIDGHVTDDVRAYLDGREHPVGRYRALPTLRDAELLCSAGGMDKGEEPHCPDLSQLQIEGKSVVIGDAVAADKQDFMGRDLYGAELQARYIDALLRKDYLREWPWLPQAVIWFAILAGVALFCAIKRQHRTQWFIGGVLLWPLLCLIVGAVASRLNYYPPVELLVAGGVLLVTALLAEIIYDLGEDVRKEYLEGER